MDTVTQLRDALIVREAAQLRLLELENDTSRAARQPKTLAAEIERQKARISTTEKEVETLRARLVSEKQKAESERAGIESKLAAFSAAGGAGKAISAKEESSLRERLAKTAERIESMEQGIAAQSSKDIRSFKSIVPGRDRGTADIMQDPTLRRYTQITSMDWPGATVPERLMMLFREAKKSDSRRPIVISSIVVAVVSVVLLAVTLINGALNPGDGQSPLGKGDLYVPVLVADADDLGVLEMTIEYDDAVLSGITATSGPIAETAAVDCNVETPGIMKVRVVSANGVSGSGAIVLLRFRVDDIVLQPAGLDVTAVTAKGSLSMATVPVEFEDGSVNTATLESVAPVVRF